MDLDHHPPQTNCPVYQIKQGKGWRYFVGCDLPLLIIQDDREEGTPAFPLVGVRRNRKKIGRAFVCQAEAQVPL